MIQNCSNNNVLLLGSGLSAVPLARLIKTLGFQLLVCGNNPEDPCHHLADKSIYLDYSDSKQILSYCRTSNIDYIVPACNDKAYMTGAFIASHLRHISGYDTLELATILHTKDKLRFMLEAKGHPSPKRYTLEQASKIVSKNQPLIIKPVDNSSGIGIATARSITELELGVSSSSLASKSSAVVIEDYILGDLVSHSAFIAEGKIYQDFFVNEFCTVYPYQVNSSCHPSNIEDKIKESISNTMQQIISDAGLVNGLLHTQIIISDSSWYIIESMRRAPGDLYGHLIVKSTIFPYWLHYIQPFLGISSSTTGFLSTNRNKLIARHTITCSSQCYPDSYRIHLPSKELEVFQLQASSQRLNKAPFDKKAHLFFEFSEKHELHYYTQRLNKFINLHVH